MEEIDDKSFRRGVITGIIPTLIVCIVACIAIYVRCKAGSVKLSADTIKKINSVTQIIDSQFLFDVDEKKIETGIIKGYMNGLEDKYSTYYTKEEMEEISQGMQGTYSGFGIGIAFVDGQLVVKTISEGGPAEKAGIQVEDIIIAVDGVKLSGTTIDEISAPLEGSAGTTSTITVLRNGKEVNLDITRQNIENTYVKYVMLEDKIAYIGISHFTNATVGQFKKAVDTMIAEGAEAVIFDVRNNLGGTLDSVIGIVDYLLPNGLVMYTENKNGKRIEYNSTNADAKLTIPSVILTNEKTASASEVFSGALKDHGYAKTVGKNTFGKGIVQSIYKLYDGSAVKITYERYFTPRGVCIHEIGIAPDVEVELDTDKLMNDRVDTQLNAAISTVKELKK